MHRVEELTHQHHRSFTATYGNFGSFVRHFNFSSTNSQIILLDTFINTLQQHQTMIQINTTEPRIPIALQNVFLASNRGNEVLQPPPQNAASRTFFRFLGITSVDDSQLLASTQDSPQRKNQRLFSLGSPKKAMKQEADGAFSSPLKPKHPLGVRDTLAPPITRIKPNGSPKKPVS